MDRRGKILIVDDNEDVLFALNALLSLYVEKVRVTTDPNNIARFMSDFQPDIILMDMNFSKDMMSGMEGFAWLKKILKIDPEAVVILMTAYADTPKIVQAIKSGATDFISKPWDKQRLLGTINSALKLKDSQTEVKALKSEISNMTKEPNNSIIGESEAMEEIFSIIEKIKETEANVLLLGENGVGKDLIAGLIHDASARSNEVFVHIDLGSIPETIFESELFGHEKGAFTDAKKQKRGRIEIASGGTLFLNEIGNLPLAMQAKLLSTIEKKYISRLGTVADIPIDVRFISATNTDIYQAVEEGKFRQDLLYRINTIEITIPPLRQRGNDIILLAEYFVDRLARKYKKEPARITAEAKRKLLAYSWPGNVRELQNVMERAIVLSSGKSIRAEDLILSSNREVFSKNDEILNIGLLEHNTIQKAIQRSGGNLTKAAELLGITRYALYRKLNKNE